MVTGSKGSLLELKKQLQSEYPIKASVIGAGSEKCSKALNRRRCWREREGYCTNTTSDTLTFSLRFRSSKKGTPCKLHLFDDVKDEHPVQLDPRQISKYRSHVARCLFLSQDRADITFAVNELCQRMSDPTQHNFAKMKQLVRYLEGEMQWIQVFKFGDMVSEVTVSETKKRGNRQARELRQWTTLLKACTRKQKIITSSSAEAEVHAAALGASEAKGVESVMSDLGIEVKPVLIIVAKAPEHIRSWPTLAKPTLANLSVLQC